MSVDPDDRTPLAIRNASDEIVTYGAPVLPGAMFMLAYKKREDSGADEANTGAGSKSDIPIMGAARMRDVLETHDLRSCAAAYRGRRASDRGRFQCAGRGRTVPEL